MIAVSNEFFQVMQERTDFKQLVTITLANGVTLELQDGDFVIDGNTVYSGARENSVPLGCAISRSVHLELMNDDGHLLDYDFFGAKISLSASLQLSASTERIYYGEYTVVTPESYGITVGITGVDDMYKADKPYTPGISYPATLQTILTDICTSLGYVRQSADFSNSGFTVDARPENVTYRQMLGYIAMIAGGNAAFNREGRLVIMPYDLSAFDDSAAVESYTNAVIAGTAAAPRQFLVLKDWIDYPSVDTGDITVTGVQTENTDGGTVLQGTAGYVLSVNNPLITGKEAAGLALIGNAVVGMRFRQFSGQYIGYPIAEFMDPVVIIDRGGKRYKSFLTDVDYTFRGITEFRNSAEPVLRNQSRYYDGSRTRTLQQARQIINSTVSQYDASVMLLANLISQSMGFYVTEETQQDGSKIRYQHDKATLAESTNIWRMSGNVVSVSSDGGETWHGMDVSGNAVLNTLAAQGINADWINAGTVLAQYLDVKGLAVTDTNGDSTLKIETDGNVYLRVASLFLSGTDINTVITNAVNNGKMTDSELKNMLSGNGANDGLFLLQNGNLYINATYINTGNLAGWTIDQANKRLISPDNTIILDAQNKKITCAEYKPTGTDYSHKTEVSHSTVDSPNLHTDYAEIGGGYNSAGNHLLIGAAVMAQATRDEFRLHSLFVDGAGIYCDLAQSSGDPITGIIQSSQGFSSGNYKLAVSASSSKKYKNHVRLVSSDDVKPFYKLPVAWFTYKDGYLADGDEWEGKNIPGFYAEDIDEIMPVAASHRNGRPEAWKDKAVIPIMMRMIQDLAGRVDDLEQQLKAMRGKNGSTT